MQQIAYSIHNKYSVFLRFVPGLRGGNILFLYKNRLAVFTHPIIYIHSEYLAATNQGGAELIASFPIGFKRCNK